MQWWVNQKAAMAAFFVPKKETTIVADIAHQRQELLSRYQLSV